MKSTDPVCCLYFLLKHILLPFTEHSIHQKYTHMEIRHRGVDDGFSRSSAASSLPHAVHDYQGITPLFHIIFLLELLDHLRRNITDIPCTGKHPF